MEGFKAKFALFAFAALEAVKLKHPDVEKDPDGYFDVGEFLDELSDVLERCGVVIPTIPIGSTVYCVLENAPGDYYLDGETVKGVALHSGVEYISFKNSLEFCEIDHDLMFPTIDEGLKQIEILKKRDGILPALSAGDYIYIVYLNSFNKPAIQEATVMKDYYPDIHPTLVLDEDFEYDEYMGHKIFRNREDAEEYIESLTKEAAQ